MFALALAARGLHVWQLGGTPMLSVPLGDAISYGAWAREIAGGSWIGDETFYQAPLYPYFLAVVYQVFGAEIGVVRVVQALLGALSCALVADATGRLFGGRAGWLGGGLLALYGPSLFFGALIQKSILDEVLLAALLWLLARQIVRPGRAAALGLGVVVGLLALVRENALVFAPVLLLHEAVPLEAPTRIRVGRAALLVLGTALVLLPVGVRNASIGGTFHLTTSQFGPNFYMGNSEHADGLYRPLLPGRGDARYERHDARRLAQQALGRSLSPAEVSAYWTRRALADMREDPVRWLRAMSLKGFYMLSAAEVIDTEDPYTHAESSLVLRVAWKVLHFGVLLPLAMLGGVMAWGRWRSLWPLYGLLAAYAGSLLVFYIFARYRYPLAPLCVPFAALAVAEGPTWLRAQASSRAVLAATGAAVLLAAVVSNWPWSNPAAMQATMQLNLSAIYGEEGDQAASTRALERAVGLVPDKLEPRLKLATALAREGRLDEAAAQLDYVAQRRPGDDSVRLRVADLALERGEIDRAGRLYRELLSRSPRSPRSPRSAAAARGLGRVLLARGQAEEAARELRRSLSSDATDVRAWVDLASALERSGEPGPAARALERAVALDPSREDLWRRLAELESSR